MIGVQRLQMGEVNSAACGRKDRWRDIVADQRKRPREVVFMNETLERGRALLWSVAVSRVAVPLRQGER